MKRLKYFALGIIRNHLLIRVYKQIRSRRQRIYLIEELIQTEKNYIADLQILVEVRESLQITLQSTERAIFMNVDQIIEQNQKFYEKLQKNFVQFHIKLEQCKNNSEKSKIHKQEMIFNDICVQGFKVYFEYCKKYTNSLKKLKEQQQFDPTINDALFVNKSRMRNMQITDFLIKPCQRLPKYNLLFKDILKNTSINHADYQNIQKLLKDFEDLNDQNNQTMDKFSNRARVKEISEEFGIPHIYEQNEERLLMNENPVSVIIQDNEVNGLLYVFTDLIIIGQKNFKDKLQILIEFKLDTQTIVKDQVDAKYFTNLYSLVNCDTTIQFTAQNLQVKMKQIEALERVIQYVKSKAGTDQYYPITVRVVGIEERLSYSINHFTVYILEIEIERIVLKMYIRFSKSQELLKIFKAKFHETKFDEFNAGWLNNHTTKVIEQRSIWIEKLIQQILILGQRDHQNSIFILQNLELPENFYELPKLNPQVDIEIRCQLKSVIVQKQQDIGVSDILDSYFQAKKSRIRISTIQDTGVYEVLDDLDVQNQQHKIKVKVYTFEGKFKQILITRNSRAAEVVKAVAQSLDISYFYDFKLMIEDKYLIKRVLDDDELILQVYNKSNNGLLGSSINKLEQFWTESDEEKLLFRKVIFLEPQFEFTEMYKDYQRLEFMVEQYFYDIREMKFPLSKEKLYLFTAFYLIINKLDLRIEYIEKFLKKQHYDQLRPKIWEEEVKKKLTEINSKIIPYETEKKPRVYLCQHQFLKQIFLEREAVMNLYKLELHRDLQNQVKKTMPGIKVNVLLGLSQQYLTVLEPIDWRVVQQIKLEHVNKIKSFPSKLIIELKEVYITAEWKFVTLQSYEIKMLIQFYLNLIT